MKKSILLLICFMLCCHLSIYASAESDEDNFEDLSSEIITMANDLYREKLSRAVVETDIDFASAQKIYTDTNIFELDTTSYAEISEVLNNGTYIYELPVYVGDDTIIANIQKGLPLNPDADLTAEEQAEVLNNAGKWTVSVMYYYEDTTIDYDAQIASAIDEPVTNVLLVGSLPYFRTVVAITADEHGELDKLIPLTSSYGTNTSSTSVYEYSEIRDYVNHLSEDDEDFNLAPIVIAAIAAVIGIAYFRHRRKESYK